MNPLVNNGNAMYSIKINFLTFLEMEQEATEPNGKVNCSSPSPKGWFYKVDRMGRFRILKGIL
ncbi:hypothetical protein DHC50_15850 [Arenibacter sp. A80]|jgi:hypothetical protein|nr:hypothetical protein [Arenibacter sp. A80]RFT55475.1 hypothetical protein D0S24_15850 [Arenibacter sp. P308M17]